MTNRIARSSAVALRSSEAWAGSRNSRKNNSLPPAQPLAVNPASVVVLIWFAVALFVAVTVWAVLHAGPSTMSPAPAHSVCTCQTTRRLASATALLQVMSRSIGETQSAGSMKWSCTACVALSANWSTPRMVAGEFAPVTHAAAGAALPLGRLNVVLAVTPWHLAAAY